MPISRTPPPAAPTAQVSPPPRTRIVPLREDDPPFATSESAPASDKPAEYEVGYKKPPKHSQFKPGRSGNPKGRSKEAKGLKKIVKEKLTQKILARTASGAKRVSLIEGVIQKLIELAMKGNPRALEKLLTLYTLAVPDVLETLDAPTSQDLTATDQAILDAFISNFRDGETLQ
jgi:hypothetical protein